MKKTFSQLRENLGVPIGQTYDRELMPQITDPKAFIEHLRTQNIPFDRRKIDSNTLKSTQLNFDMNKVHSLLGSKDSNPIFVSKDNNILDGHHRWLANYYSGKPTDCHVVDLPILELMRVAKEHINSDKLNEELTHKDFGPMLDSFVSFASNKLGIKSLPNIRYKDSNEDFSSFGGYNPSEKSIVIATKNRHPMDIYRTLAHELVHCKQDEDGRIKDVSKEGSTGSDIENEANAVAGQIMRWYAKANPDSFKLAGLVESKAIFVVGVPCSGKDAIIRNLQESQYYQEIDIQTIDKKKNQLAENLIISGSAHNFEEIKKANNFLLNRGYMTEMIFVDVPNNISKLRNEQREAKGQRVISESIRFKKYEQSKSNLDLYEQLFDTVHLVINEEGLHQWFKSRSKDGKRGWVQVGGRYDGKPCARQPGQTSTPKCRSSSEAARMTKKEKQYAFKKKQREDPNQPEKSGAAKPTMVKTYKEKKMNEEKDACYHKVKARYKVWPSAYASGALVKCRKAGAANWGKKSVKEAINVNRENQITDVDKQFTKFMEDTTAELNTYKREEGTTDLANLYKKGTPGQWVEEEQQQKEETIVRDDIGGPSVLRNPLSEKKKIVRKKKIEEDGVLDTASGAVGLPVSDSIGAEFGVAKSPSLIGGLVGVSSPISGFGPAGSLYPFGTYGISESVISWANNPKTIERFNKKYGRLAEQKLLETIKVINESIENKESRDMPKSIKQIRESWEGRAGRDMGTVSYSHAEDKVNEETPAWQRKEGKDPEGGLNRKGIASYRRANPGSKLSMAVTTDPSKLKKGSKKAKRRLSFCRRMKGMKEKFTSAKTARDPDSRINKSLRKWNCE